VPFWVLGLGWAVVVVWFSVFDLVVGREAAGSSGREREGAAGRGWLHLLLDPGRLVEAALLTLVAGLWFASLGHGGWFLLFPLLGAWAGWVTHRRGRAPLDRAAMKALAVEVVRTTAAGGLLQWVL
jgi:hypothetical protein